MGLFSFHNSPLPRHCQWDPQNLSRGSAMAQLHHCWSRATARAAISFWIFLLARRHLHRSSPVMQGSFSTYVHGAGTGVNVTARVSLHPFAPHSSARWEEQMICRACSSPSSSCPVKQAVDLEEYALEGNAAWITIWHVWFLTYFLRMHLVLWFLSSHFSITVWQENLG